MSKTQTKSRTLYSYKSSMYLRDPKNDELFLKWSPDKLTTLFDDILKLPFDKRTLSDTVNQEWTLTFEGYRYDNDISPRFILGTFSSTKNGLRTKLLNEQTKTIKPNPKAPGENEIRTTCFGMRISDGLFILATYSDNVANPLRITGYLADFAKLTKSPIVSISFDHLISNEFIDSLNSFERINKFMVSIDTTELMDKTKDAFSVINEETAKMNHGKINLELIRKDIKGLSAKEILQFWKNNTKRHHILQGTVKGKPSPGHPKELRFLGINEKHNDRFPIDNEGEVLSEHLFRCIINIMDSRKTLY